MFNAPNSIWTDERREQLKMLWADGYSVSVIATKMGCFEDRPDKGRSAVIGTIRRMKLQRPVAKKKRVVCHPKPASNIVQLRRQTAVVPIASPTSPDEIYGPGLQVVHLTEFNCHYGHGDPRVHGFEFCGAPAVPGLPWCAYHAKRIYVQPRDPT